MNVFGRGAKFLVAGLLVAGCANDMGSRWGAPNLGVVQQASTKSQEDLGVQSWRVRMIDANSVNVDALGADGSMVGNAIVGIDGETWIADLNGTVEGESVIDFEGVLVEDTLTDTTMIEYCAKNPFIGVLSVTSYDSTSFQLPTRSAGPGGSCGGRRSVAPGGCGGCRPPRRSTGA